MNNRKALVVTGDIALLVITASISYFLGTYADRQDAICKNEDARLVQVDSGTLTPLWNVEPGQTWYHLQGDQYCVVKL